MIRYRVPERVDVPPPKKQMHLTVRGVLGTATFAATVTTTWGAITSIVPPLPAVGAVAALLVLTVWALGPPRGIAPLYEYAPGAPLEARARGRLTTAVVEQSTIKKKLGNGTRETSRLLVTTPNGGRYRTTTTALCPQAAAPTHRAGDVVAVRVHPEQQGVVVIVDDEPPGSPPERPSRPVPEYSGVPAPTRGTSVPELRGTLLGLGVLVVGALAPLVVLALLQLPA